MISRLLIAGGVVVAAAVVAAVLRRRQRVDAPTQSRWNVPAQVDRADFARPEAPWLVAVFSSATCTTCADVVAKATVLASPQVVVDDVEYMARKATHQRYAIDAVPTLVIVDADGVVRHQILGPVSATDLWAAMARVRDPEAHPELQHCHRDDEHD